MATLQQAKSMLCLQAEHKEQNLKAVGEGPDTDQTMALQGDTSVLQAKSPARPRLVIGTPALLMASKQG